MMHCWLIPAIPEIGLRKAGAAIVAEEAGLVLDMDSGPLWGPHAMHLAEQPARRRTVGWAATPPLTSQTANSTSGGQGVADSALRYFALDGTGHASHQEQASMIGRNSIWRKDHARGERLRRSVDPGRHGLTR
jgi:hypothetical protein